MNKEQLAKNLSGVGRVLIAGARADWAASVSAALMHEGHRVSVADAQTNLADAVAAQNPDVLLLAMAGSDTSPGSLDEIRPLLERVRASRAKAQIILLAPEGSITPACALAAEGLIDFVESAEAAGGRLALMVRRAAERKALLGRLAQLETSPDGEGSLPGIVVASNQMRAVLARASLLAQDSTNVVIEGEDGTGRASIARAIHLGGPRSGEPFIRIRCTESPAELAQLCEEAGRGTIFLEAIDRLRGRRSAPSWRSWMRRSGRS